MEQRSWSSVRIRNGVYIKQERIECAVLRRRLNKLYAWGGGHMELYA
jgi:hypothetical protein